MTKPIGILYEHPDWFAPLFAALDRRGTRYERIPAHSFRYDPAATSSPYRLVVNRVSPSAYLRGNTSAIFQTQHYLAHLEAIGVPVINGVRPYTLETSKARQLALLAELALPHPRSRVVNAVEEIAPAAMALAFPVIVKPNIGGSGALMRRFDALTDVQDAVGRGELDSIFGLDYTAIVQEFHPGLNGSSVRVEVLDGQILYAIRIYNPNLDFNICPADICQVPEGEAAALDGKKPLRIEVVQPPAGVEEAVLRIFATAGTEVGGVEYLESERDGHMYFYDINALSNFVTDAPRLIGFDPFVRFAEYIEQRAAVPALTATRA
ncbi:MAG: hypothetical protein M3Y58_11580 [Chloroflexota bacterium]|nr:hypothetical protein [Chloroflexota bacterium]